MTPISLTAGVSAREPCWTEAVAVGDKAFITEAEKGTAYRQRMERYPVAGSAGEKVWAIRDATIPCKPNSGEESMI